MYDAIRFGDYFMSVLKGKATSLSSYNVNLRKIDREIDGGIDAYIGKNGETSFIDWLRAKGDHWGQNSSNVRSAGNAYVRFRNDGIVEEAEVAEEPTAEENRLSVFRYENELQEAVRLQIEAIEPNLRIEDGGSEAILATGRSDILARDATGCAVVIELKAGRCPKGAIEQVLGYAQDWIDAGAEQRVRSILIAGDFSQRTIAAARRIPDLELKTYELAVQFKSV